MDLFLQWPLVIFLVGGILCVFVLFQGLRDAVKLWRRRLRASDDEASEADEAAATTSHPHLRFAGSLVLLGALAFFAVQLWAGVGRMVPALWQMKSHLGAPLPEVVYAPVEPDRAAAAAARRITELQGRVVLVNVWATWCGPCRTEMPALARLQESHGDRGLTVLHLSREPMDTLRGWLAENPTPSRHGQVGSLPFPTPAIPTSLVLDREGVVRDVMVGAASYGSFRDAVEPWL